MKRRNIEITFRPHQLEEGPDEDDLRMTAEERMSLVWELTVDAWAFKGEPLAESRLPRHIVHILRGAR